jgi:hypothetical protein
VFDVTFEITVNEVTNYYPQKKVLFGWYGLQSLRLEQRKNKIDKERRERETSAHDKSLRACLVACNLFWVF